MTEERGPRPVALPRGAKARAHPLLERLKDEYPPRYCFLEGAEDPFRLLTAVILSAQCTDEQVNRTTPALFAEFPTPEALAGAPRSRVEELVFSTGFYRAKARHIQEMAAALVEDHGGAVPDTMEALTKLPGVGRKTANVVLTNCWNRAEGVCVDTHVGRLARRMGLTREEDPVKVERDLMRLYPRDAWPDVTYLLISHGREYCPARAPRCGACPVAETCAQKGLHSPGRSKKSAKAGQRPGKA